MKINMDDINYVTVDSLRESMSQEKDLLLLDCRTNEEYRIGHISGSHNIVLPQLMMRRLKANKLSLKSLVPPNFRHEKEAFLKKCTTFQVVLYDHFTSELNNNDTSMLGLLYNRMKNESCSVFILKGGYSKFEIGHSDFCVKAGSTPSSDADDEDCGSDECAGSPRGGRCSPVSSLPGMAPAILGLGALRISCDSNNEGEDSDNGDNRLSRARRTNQSSCDNHRHHSNCLRHHDNFNSEGESDDPNSATSISSSECIVPLSVKTTPCTCCSCSKGNQLPSNLVCPSPSVYGNANGPVEILPGLFLGCAKDASSAETLSRYNITYILNVTPNLPNVFEEDGTYNYKQIPITDHWSQNLSQFFPEAISFIDEARSKKCGVLVHCLAGISRSVTVTVAYLMQKLRWSLNDAYDFVKQRKNNVSPNFNFMGQLLDFEKTLGLGDYSSPEEGGVSSASSAASTPPTLFFTSPPPPTPKLTLPIRKKGKKVEQRSAFILPTSTA